MADNWICKFMKADFHSKHISPTSIHNSYVFQVVQHTKSMSDFNPT